MTKVPWRIPAEGDAPAQEFELELGPIEMGMYRRYYDLIRRRRPGPQRSALIMELRVQMDMIALLDATIVVEEPEVVEAPEQLVIAC